MVYDDGLFDDYSFDISIYLLCFVNSSLVLVWIYIVISTHAFMVCFQYFRNLKVNSFLIAIYPSN